MYPVRLGQKIGPQTNRQKTGWIGREPEKTGEPADPSGSMVSFFFLKKKR
jgi:hypothetical protein